MAGNRCVEALPCGRRDFQPVPAWSLLATFLSFRVSLRLRCAFAKGMLKDCTPICSYIFRALSQSSTPTSITDLEDRLLIIVRECFLVYDTSIRTLQYIDNGHKQVSQTYYVIEALEQWYYFNPGHRSYAVNTQRRSSRVSHSSFSHRTRKSHSRLPSHQNSRTELQL